MDALSFEGFSFSYAGDARRVLDGVDWHVREGAFVLLEGATGSGKTTLLRSAHPVLAPAGKREGEVSVLGRAWAREGEQARAAVAGTGFVSQDPQSQLVCDTVWHEMAFGLENDAVDQDQMRRRVAETAHYFGIEPWFSRRTSELSGGQAQVLNLAAALCRRPRLLLLDEPTAQLDPVAAAGFAHALFRANRELGVTVVVATHDAPALRDYATEEAHMEDGRVIAGPLPEGQDVPPVEPRPMPAGAQETVSMRGVWFRYPASRREEAPWVLRDCDWHAERGSVHALLGGNGCGKTTLLLNASCAVRPERGSVKNRSRAQAYLPQAPQTLFACRTVAEELAEWQAAPDADEARRVAGELGVEGLADQAPDDLSGGQQQLVALAKVLLSRPDLLLLDEPTKGLDARARRTVARILRRAADEGAAVVVATHDLPFVCAAADTASMVFDGSIASTEPVRGFFRDNLFFRPRPDACAQLGVRAFWEEGR